MSAFDELFAQITARPVMYVGTKSIDAVSDYLYGYCHALIDAGQPNPLDGWAIWIYHRFLIWHPGWSWTRVLLHVYRTDKDALSAMIPLYAQFSAERPSIDVNALEADLQRQLVAKYGQNWYEPEITHTPCPSTRV